jgi:NTP pyrophosphatase (non-canonical NTP hydrolase)
MNKEQKEIFFITQEECAEVTQAISKVLRFGMDSYHPVTNKSNKHSLEEEIGDLLAMIEILIRRAIISDSNVNEARIQKMEKLKKWSKIKLESHA